MSNGSSLNHIWAPLSQTKKHTKSNISVNVPHANFHLKGHSFYEAQVVKTQ